jgi:cytochrome c-type biogenesis protein CcmH
MTERPDMKSKSPLPPFCKVGNSGGQNDGSPRLSSPFAKGGSRGTCVSLLFGLLLALFAATAAFAQKATDPAPLQFNSTVEEKRFHALVAELRCVMCQNQSLADSNAQIAVDLRREVLQLMREGRSDQEVRDFLVARYGEFVLYRPQVEAKTWLLWFGPLLFALLGGVVVWRLLRRNAGAATPPADDSQEW